MDAVFCVNDPVALAAMAAAESGGKLGRVKIVGFDGPVEARRAVRDGKNYATV